MVEAKRQIRKGRQQQDQQCNMTEDKHETKEEEEKEARPPARQPAHQSPDILYRPSKQGILYLSVDTDVNLFFSAQPLSVDCWIASWPR